MSYSLHFQHMDPTDWSEEDMALATKSVGFGTHSLWPLARFPEFEVASHLVFEADP